MKQPTTNRKLVTILSMAEINGQIFTKSLAIEKNEQPKEVIERLIIELSHLETEKKFREENVK